MFDLHPQLKQDCIELGGFVLCRLLLMNERRFPWLILVPEREDVTEIYQLSEEDQSLLLRESSALARSLVRGYAADKLNIAAIGNVVPQLHLHHIVRYREDAAWPAPVWGKFAIWPYEKPVLAAQIERLESCLPKDFNWIQP